MGEICEVVEADIIIEICLDGCCTGYTPTICDLISLHYAGTTLGVMSPRLTKFAVVATSSFSDACMTGFTRVRYELGELVLDGK